jgi:large subunit ribosomal protein L21
MLLITACVCERRSLAADRGRPVWPQPAGLEPEQRGVQNMYAIVKIKDKQFRVEPEAMLTVPLLENNVGDVVDLDDVLLCSDGQDVKVGNPRLSGVSIKAEVLRHVLAEKVVVFKKKRRKNYRRKRGHRQPVTEIRIKQIVGD